MNTYYRIKILPILPRTTFKFQVSEDEIIYVIYRYDDSKL